ncbi:MAG: hypothetical protein NTZ34_00425 [Chloroflexi bacterium]|nr:hypothetical protein [Chloroflexota bacterium]
MTSKLRISAIVLFILAFIGLLFGIIFLYEAFSRQAYLANAMQQENISLSDIGIKNGPPGIIDNMEKAQIAADTVRTHRHTIAPSYGALMGGGKYDPANPTHLLYAQALNIENYLYLAVLGFGVIQIAMAAGGFMIIVAIALGIIGFVLLKLNKA